MSCVRAGLRCADDPAPSRRIFLLCSSHRGLLSCVQLVLVAAVVAEAVLAAVAVPVVVVTVSNVEASILR